jgi:hypothetical protein
MTADHDILTTIPLDVFKGYVCKNLIPLHTKQPFVWNRSNKSWYSFFSLISTCKSLYEAKTLLIAEASSLLAGKILEIEVLAAPHFASLVTTTMRKRYEKEVSIRERLREKIPVLRKELSSGLQSEIANFEEAIKKDKENYPALCHLEKSELLTTLSNFPFSFRTSTRKVRENIQNYTSMEVQIDLAHEEIPEFDGKISDITNYWWCKRNLFSKYSRMETDDLTNLFASELRSVQASVFSLWSLENNMNVIDNAAKKYNPLQLKDGQVVDEPYKAFRQAMKNYKELHTHIVKNDALESY